MPDADTDAERIASEARDLVRRAAGDVAGLTVAAQIRQAARHLGFPVDHWRPRECWYGRGASPTALDDLRRRFAAWGQEECRAAEQRPGATADVARHHALAAQLDAIRAGLAEVTQQVDELTAQIHPVGGSN